MSNDKTASRNLGHQKASSSIDVLMSKPAFSGGNLLADEFRPEKEASSTKEIVGASSTGWWTRL